MKHVDRQGVIQVIRRIHVMLRTIIICTVIAISILAVMGCSQSQLLEPAARDIPERVSEVDDHILWGYYQFIIDPARQSVEVVPARQIMIHANVKAFVSPPACYDCIKVQPTGPYAGNTLPVNITLKNPTPLTGHDVRGILLSDDEGADLLNPDNYTDLFDNGGLVNINPFMAFAKSEIGRTFGGGVSHTEHFDLYLASFGKVGVIDFAVDASWPSRAKEPYSIIGPVAAGTLDSYGVLECPFQADIEAANDDVDEVWLDLSSIGFASEIEMELSTSGSWEVVIMNENLSPAGEYEGWCRASTASSGMFLYSKFAFYIQIGIEPVSLADDVQPIFDEFCISCHQTVSPPLGLDLSAGNSFSNTVNVDSVQSTYKRILPMAAFESYLPPKLMGMHAEPPYDGSGNQMPLGGDPLDFEYIHKIISWIDQGALDN